MVAENHSWLTTCQFSRDKLARQIYDTIEHLSIRYFQNMVRSCAIKNRPLTLEDIKITNSISG